MVDPESAPEFAIHQANAAELVHDHESIEHRAEHGLDAKVSLAHSLLELASLIRQVLESQSDPARVRVSADEKFPRRSALDDVVSQLFHILPGCDPFAPDSEADRERDREEEEQGEPTHLA